LPASDIDEFQCPVLSRHENDLPSDVWPTTPSRIELVPCDFSMQGALLSGIPHGQRQDAGASCTSDPAEFVS